MAFYNTMNTNQKQNLNSTLQRYAISKFSCLEIGRCHYKQQNIISDSRVTYNKFFFDSHKQVDVNQKHKVTTNKFLSVLLDEKSYHRIGTLRDFKHEDDTSTILCLDDKNRIESRWNSIFVDYKKDIIKTSYNIRIHEYSKDSIVGLITCYVIPFTSIAGSSMLRNNYNKVIKSMFIKRDPMASILRRFYNESFIKPIKVNLMKFTNKSTGETIDLNEEDLITVPEENLQELDVVNEEDYPWLLNALFSYEDLLKLYPYYSKDDKINDSDGSLRKRYLDLYCFQDYNEENLLKYNHKNTQIYNDLLDIKYTEVGDRRIINNQYLAEQWTELGPAFDSIVYGYDQDVVYKNLCAAFGKSNVDMVWRKHYRGKDDGLIR